MLIYTHQHTAPSYLSAAMCNLMRFDCKQMWLFQSSRDMSSLLQNWAASTHTPNLSPSSHTTRKTKHLLTDHVKSRQETHRMASTCLTDSKKQQTTPATKITHERNKQHINRDRAIKTVKRNTETKFEKILQ